MAEDSADLQAMLSRQAYRGIRHSFSFGYPACPNVGDQDEVEVLLNGGGRRGSAAHAVARPGQAAIPSNCTRQGISDLPRGESLDHLR